MTDMPGKGAVKGQRVGWDDKLKDVRKVKQAKPCGTAGGDMVRVQHAGEEKTPCTLAQARAASVLCQTPWSKAFLLTVF